MLYSTAAMDIGQWEWDQYVTQAGFELCPRENRIFFFFCALTTATDTFFLRKGIFSGLEEFSGDFGCRHLHVKHAYQKYSADP